MVGRGLLKAILSGICCTLTLFVASSATAGNSKVEICHVPPGNPANFHTIRISQKALTAHAGHGDFISGPCNDFCAELCDDGDACTVADTGDCGSGCPPPTSVDCDDGEPCTVDSCDSIEGCVNDAAPCECPCFDSIDLATITAVPFTCSPTTIDSRNNGCPPLEDGLAKVTTGIGTTTCTFVTNVENPNVSGCVRGSDIQGLAISPDQAGECLALIADACPAP